MISEEQQDQAALYVLGLLEPPEAAAFESELTANAELRDIARELREAAGIAALAVPPQTPTGIAAIHMSPDFDRNLENRLWFNAAGGRHGGYGQRSDSCCFAQFASDIAQFSVRG